MFGRGGWENWKWNCAKGEYVRVPNPRKKAKRARRGARRRAPPAARGLHYLKVEAPDGTTLKYMGGIKFSRKGQPVPFFSRAQARGVWSQLKHFHPVLRQFKLLP